MPLPSLFPKFMNPLSTGGGTNVVEAFEIELQAAPDVEVAQSVEVDITTPDVDVEINEPVDVEVPN